MTAERARLMRLRRLERVRAIARQSAATEAARAEGTLAQLRALAERSRRLADENANPPRGPTEGWMLGQYGRFGGGLQQVSAETSHNARQARAEADARLAALGEAERRRAMVEERAEAQERKIARAGELPSLARRRGNWHGS